MTQTESPDAMFPGLVFNENGELAEIAYIGGVAHYVILDDGFRRHVEARGIDRQVLLFVREQMEPYRGRNSTKRTSALEDIRQVAVLETRRVRCLAVARIRCNA